MSEEGTVSATLSWGKKTQLYYRPEWRNRWGNL